MPHAVRLPPELDEPPVVHDAVYHGRRHLVVAEDAAPARELEVGRDDHALSLVGVREHLEDEPGPVGVQRQEPELVDHEQAGPGDLRHLAVEPALLPRPAQAHDERGRGTARRGATR